MNKMLTMVVSALVAGCAVGPGYESKHESKHEPLSQYSLSETVQNDQAATHSAGLAFWQGFEDPVLERLVAMTLNGNNDLHAMVARYQGASALLRHARRDRWPSVTAFAAGSDQNLAEVEQIQPAVDERELYQAGLALQWEIDLFGRLAKASDARHAELEASAADVQAVQVALIGQLASSYFELRGLQQQLAVAQQNIALQESSLAIVSSRLDAGRGTRLDELRARAQRDTTRAAIPELRAAIQSSMHRIAVLTGNPPNTLIEELSAAGALPEAVPHIPAASPGDTLRRRPDILAAERRVAAAAARIGVATADLFPRFTLEGLLGSVAGDGGDLFSSGTGSRRITLGIDWTFLDFAQVKARIDLADAEAAAALAEYHQAVLLALEETETSLVHYQQAQERVALLDGAQAAATEAVAQARERYTQGYIDYYELLGAELELTRARNLLAQSRTSQALAMVSVYQSLAGAPEIDGLDASSYSYLPN